MNKGFIGYLTLIIIALAIAKYFFDWSIFDALESEKGIETTQYLKDVIIISWQYVHDFAILVWQKIASFWPMS